MTALPPDDDIVAQLRVMADPGRLNYSRGWFAKAADEIVRLRAELSALRAERGVRRGCTCDAAQGLRMLLEACQDADDGKCATLPVDFVRDMCERFLAVPGGPITPRIPLAALHEVIDKYCLHKPHLSAIAEAAFYAFNKALAAPQAHPGEESDK